MPEQMTKQDAIETLEIFRNDYTREGSAMCRAIGIALDALRQPTIEPEVRRGKGCKFCKGRSYTKKPLTVITRTMKHVEVVLEYCPACGRKMDGGSKNG